MLCQSGDQMLTSLKAADPRVLGDREERKVWPQFCHCHLWPLWALFGYLV